MDKPPTPIHVFRAGRHTTAAGETIEFSQADLAAVAASYDPALHQAPLVIGHPKSDDPAYGWASRFEVRGADLYAIPDQVQPAFAELVNGGAYKQRSLAWYRPTDAANPKPGVWYPRHIGFLGAVPPALKGLRPVQFKEGGEPVEIEFSEWSDRSVSRLFRSLRDFILAKFGQDDADRALPDYEVNALTEEAAAELARQMANPAPAPAFSEPPHQETTTVTPEEKAAIEAENQRLAAENTALKAEQARAAGAARHAEAVQFCEGLVQAGRLLPAHKDAAIVVYELAATAAPVEFGEGEGKTTEAPLGKVKALFEALPKQIEFREVAGGKPPVTADSDPSAIAARAVEFQESERAAGRQINSAQAVAHVLGQAGT